MANCYKDPVTGAYTFDLETPDNGYPTYPAVIRMRLTKREVSELVELAEMKEALMRIIAGLEVTELGTFVDTKA